MVISFPFLHLLLWDFVPFGLFWVPSDLTRGGYFANVFLGGLFFLAGLRLFFYLEFLLCKRLFVALVILKYVVVGVGVVRSGENKKELTWIV